MSFVIKKNRVSVKISYQLYLAYFIKIFSPFSILLLLLFMWRCEEIADYFLQVKLREGSEIKEEKVAQPQRFSVKENMAKFINYTLRFYTSSSSFSSSTSTVPLSFIYILPPSLNSLSSLSAVPNFAFPLRIFFFIHTTIWSESHTYTHSW